MSETKKTLPIKMDENLHNTFMRICKAKEIPASVVVREFIKGFCLENGQSELNLKSAAKKKR